MHAATCTRTYVMDTPGGSGSDSGCGCMLPVLFLMRSGTVDITVL